MKYRLFGKSGLRVSELCFGVMTFGTEWGWGADYEESKRLFGTYVDAGGNFFDTANLYTEGTSERWLGGSFTPTDIASWWQRSTRCASARVTPTSAAITAKT